MRETTAVPNIVGNWFRHHREQYQWPESSSRRSSEGGIKELTTVVKSAMAGNDVEVVKEALIKIHKWKSSRTASRHEKVLNNCHSEYFERLMDMSTYKDVDELEAVVRHLKVGYCNLPVCTAIASFLYGRKSVPVIDTYVAQFFARRFNVNRNDDEMRAIFGWIARINFGLETYSKNHHRLRLAVFDPKGRGFENNLRLYIDKFIPECKRVAKALNAGGFSFSDVDGESRRFTPIDVEMAIFSWTMKNKSLADVVPTDHRYIVRKDGILSWEPIMKGTRTPVRAIVELSRLEYTHKRILEGLPHLSIEAIQDALSYYDDHTEEIEERIERNRIPDHLIHPSVRDL